MAPFTEKFEFVSLNDTYQERVAELKSVVEEKEFYHSAVIAPSLFFLLENFLMFVSR